MRNGCRVTKLSGNTTPSDALPARCDFPLVRLYAPSAPGPQARGRRGPPQFLPLPSERSTSHYAGGSSTLRFQALRVFHGLRPATPGSAPPCPLSGLDSRRGRLRFMLRTARLLPPTRLSTPGFDTGRFPPTPPACYRASWQLPGRDFHPLAVTDLWAHTIRSSLPTSDLIGCALWARSSWSSPAIPG